MCTFPRSLLTRGLTAAAFLLLAASASAHDFWIEPTKWRPEKGDLIGLQLLVGHQDERELVERKEERIERFFVSLPPATDGAEREEKAIVGAEGRAPAGYLPIQREGLHLIGYRSRNAAIELEPAKFETYLLEEGLDHVVQERARRGESAEPGREAYSRSSKCLLRAGEAGGAGFDRPIGLVLELVPLDDPIALTPGAKLRLRVLLNGAPAAGLLIEGQSLADWKLAHLAARSDEQGLVAFELPADLSWSGRWLFAGVHMSRAAEGADHDWESLWASLSFEVPGEDSPRDAAPAAVPPKEGTGGGSD